MGASAVLSALLIAGFAAMPNGIGDAIAPAAGVPSSPPGTAGDGAVQAYRADLEPYLSVIIGEGERLAELARTQSRDILELTIRLDRFREASSALLAFVDGQPPPTGLEPLVRELRSQLQSADAAIESSISAIRGFDWDALGLAVEEFDREVTEIARISSVRIE